MSAALTTVGEGEVFGISFDNTRNGNACSDTARRIRGSAKPLNGGTRNALDDGGTGQSVEDEYREPAGAGTICVGWAGGGGGARCHLVPVCRALHIAYMHTVPTPTGSKPSSSY